MASVDSYSKTSSDIFSNNVKNKNETNFYKHQESIGTDLKYKHKIVWKNAIGYLVLHFFALWGAVLLLTKQVKLVTLLWEIFSQFWFVSFLSLGEGWHNDHHTFPWDYKAAELPMPFNVSATLIRFLERIGLAYDLKSASSEMVEKRLIRTGDGTHYKLGSEEARSSVTAIGILHPLNPSYTSKLKAPEPTLYTEERVSSTN